jgi:DNA excision repair protein ERCC-4
MPDLTEIVVDDRERASGILERLRSYSDVRLRVDRLATGDYIVNNSVVFERKVAADFAASLVDARLFFQARRLVNQSFRGAFIIEGDTADWNKLCVRREALRGALLTLSLVFNLPVFRSRDMNETSRLLVYAGRQFARLQHVRASRYRVYKSRRKRTRQLRVLAALPGVGRDRAERLLNHFGSIQTCLTASVVELQEVPTIGPKIAKAIHDLVEQRISP